MLALRCTANMLKKLKKEPDANPPASDTALGDWYVNAFKLGRKEYFLFASARTLGSVVTPASQQIPMDELLFRLHKTLSSCGAAEDRIHAEISAMSPLVIAKTCNRSVLSTMNMLLECIRSKYEATEGAFDPAAEDACFGLWDMPMGAMGHQSPADAALNVLEGKEPCVRRPKRVRPHEREAVREAFREQRRLSEEKKAARTKGKVPAMTVLRPDGSKERYESQHILPQSAPERVRKNITYALRSEEAPIVTVGKIFCSTDNPGSDLAWLILYDAEEPVALHALMLLFGAIEGDGLPEKARKNLCAGAKESLKTGMRDMAVPDQRKLFAGPLLAKMGERISLEQYSSFFHDFEAASAEFANRLPPDSATPECISRHLEVVGIPMETEADEEGDDCWESAAADCARMAEKEPGAAAMMICATAAAAIWRNQDSRKDILEVLDVFRHSSDSEAMWQLQTLSLWPFSGRYGEAALTAYNEMLERGVEPRHSFVPEFSHGQISMCDGAGARHVSLFYRTPEGGMDAIAYVHKDSWGMKETFPTFRDCSHLETILGGQATHLATAPCTQSLCREVFADALALSQELGHRVPPNAFLCRQYLGEDVLALERREPNLGAYMLEALRRTPDMAADSEELKDSLSFGGLWFASDAAYDFVAANLKGRKSTLPEQQFESFVREVCIVERNELLQRMAANLEVEALAGRAVSRINRMAARTYLAIREEIVPFAEIPYVRALAEHSVLVIKENRKSGYHGQNDANQAAMDHDEGFFEMLNRMFNPFSDK